MKAGLYVIYDVKAEAPIGVIQWFSNDQAAGRMFASVIAAPGTMLNEHPEDFVLLKLGMMDLTSLHVELNTVTRMVPIAEGLEVVRALSRARESIPGNGSAPVDPRQIDFTRAGVVAPK